MLLPLAMLVMSTPLHASFIHTLLKMSSSSRYRSSSICSSYSPMITSHLCGRGREGQYVSGSTTRSSPSLHTRAIWKKVRLVR